MVIRTNQLTEIDGQRPYADAQVRRALTMAVSDAICLDLGYAGLGDVAETHHMCPIHPEYADLPAPVSDPEQAEAMMGRGPNYELISIDETTGAARSAIPFAARLRDAGIPNKAHGDPGQHVLERTAPNYAFSATEWAERLLGVQVLILA